LIADPPGRMAEEKAKHGTVRPRFLSGVLIFSVSLPQHAATFFLLGLSGSGASAQAIFDSIRAARH